MSCSSESVKRPILQLVGLYRKYTGPVYLTFAMLQRIYNNYKFIMQNICVCVIRYSSIHKLQNVYSI